MLKIISFIFLVMCATTFGAPTEEVVPDTQPCSQPCCHLKELNELQDRIVIAIEDLRNITVDNLTTGQQMVFNTTGDELNVTIDDLILYVRLHAWSTKGIFDSEESFGDLVSKLFSNEGIFKKVEDELVEFNHPSEVTIEKLTIDHAKLTDELIAETAATPDQILFLSRVLILVKQIKGERNFEGTMVLELAKRVQHESSICPVPPREANDNPSSEEIQQFLKQTISLDNTNKTEATKLAIPDGHYGSKAYALGILAHRDHKYPFYWFVVEGQDIIVENRIRGGNPLHMTIDSTMINPIDRGLVFASRVSSAASGQFQWSGELY